MEAAALFKKAWDKAEDNFEKFTAAHYVARHQKNVLDKLKWDNKALVYALKIEASEIRGILTSLYLNIAKGHEDLKELATAKSNYELGQFFSQYLLEDSYGKLIKTGIKNGLRRVQEK